MRSLSLLLLALLVTAACDLGEYDPDAVGDSGDGDGDGRYHPTGWAASASHGPDFNLQGQDCRHCHGDDLAGAIAAPSCDSCHTPETPAAWRSDCTFCHGGVDGTSGAPPGDLDGATTDAAFGAHSTHLDTATMATITCGDCHTTPTDVLSPEHAFDDTPGVAEVLFATGRSPDGVYNGAGGCDNLYCHGDGVQNKTVLASAGPMSCGGCHGEPPDTGEHGEHDGDPCSDCHSDTTVDDRTIADVALHIDGQAQIAIDNPGSLTVTRVGDEVRCNGQCHDQGRDHENDRW